MSGNPAYYAQAQGALERSLALRPDGNAAGADRAGRAGQRPARLRRRPRLRRAGAGAEPGQRGGLRRARRRGHPARRHRRPPPPPCSGCWTCGPGVAAFTRASYELELHGRRRRGAGRAGAGAGRRDQPRRARVLPLLPRRAGLGRRRARRGRARHYERGLAADPDDPRCCRAGPRCWPRPAGVDEAIAGYRRLTAAGAAAAVPAGVRRAAGVGRPAAARRRPSTGCSPSSSGC